MGLTPSWSIKDKSKNNFKFNFDWFNVSKFGSLSQSIVKRGRTYFTWKKLFQQLREIVIFEVCFIAPHSLMKSVNACFQTCYSFWRNGPKGSYKMYHFSLGVETRPPAHSDHEIRHHSSRCLYSHSIAKNRRRRCNLKKTLNREKRRRFQFKRPRHPWLGFSKAQIGAKTLNVDVDSDWSFHYRIQSDKLDFRRLQNQYEYFHPITNWFS